MKAKCQKIVCAMPYDSEVDFSFPCLSKCAITSRLEISGGWRCLGKSSSGQPCDIRGLIYPEKFTYICFWGQLLTILSSQWQMSWKRIENATLRFASCVICSSLLVDLVQDIIVHLKWIAFL